MSSILTVVEKWQTQFAADAFMNNINWDQLFIGTKCAPRGHRHATHCTIKAAMADALDKINDEQIVALAYFLSRIR